MRIRCIKVVSYEFYTMTCNDNFWLYVTTEFLYKIYIELIIKSQKLIIPFKYMGYLPCSEALPQPTAKQRVPTGEVLSGKHIGLT
jgi:hypothetical protein